MSQGSRPVPWSMAVNPNGIKDDVQKFLALIGEAIASWSNVETALGHLYATSVGAHGILLNAFHQPIVISYYAVNSFEVRLALTSAALSEAMSQHPTIPAEWATFANRIDRKAKIRNNVAHFSLYGHSDRPPGRQIWLQPNPPVWGVTRGKKPTQYYASDLVNICEDFPKVANEIQLFAAKVIRAMIVPESP